MLCVLLNPLMAALGQHGAQIHTRQNGTCAPSEPRPHTRSMQVREQTQ